MVIAGARIILGIVGFLLAAPPWLGARAAEDAERTRADFTAARIAREWPIRRLGAIPHYIDELGARLASGATSSPYPWRFTVVRDRSLNAFSIGGGRIYVTDGAVSECRDEAELAALLAHEMAHQIAGHFRNARGKARGGVSEYLETLIGPGRSSAGRVHIIGGSLVQRVDLEREREADRLSLQILRSAGYDAHAALRLAERLGNSAPGDMSSDYAARVDAIRDLLAGFPQGGQTDSAAFQVVRRRGPTE